MKIVQFEFKKQFFHMVVWTTVMIGALLCLMLAVYPLFEESAADIKLMFEGLPPAFADTFGINVKNMFGFGGFYSFSFSYISLIGGIMASSLGISIFSRETRSKCADFLLTKPVARGVIFLEKLSAGFAILVCTNILYMSAALAIGAHNNANMLLPALSLLLTQLVFYAVGITYGLFAGKVRSVSGIATAIGFTAFILSALINIFEEEMLRFIAPLKYFDPTDLFAEGTYDWRYASAGILVIVVCFTASYFHFTGSDSKSI